MANRNSKSFAEWMREVDFVIARICGLSSSDLPDICYADMYADGATPKSAARRAIRDADE